MNNLHLPNEQLLENIFLQSTNVIAITNADFDNLKFEFVNPAFLEMTGYTLDEIIGHAPYILQGPKTKRDMTQKLKEACLKGESFRGNNINYKKDGTTYQVGWTVSPIKDSTGKIVNFLSIQKDITQIKDMEDKFVKNERLDALENISSGLTHEINTSLTVCKGGLELIGYEIETVEDKESKEYLTQDLEKVNKSIDNIKYITNSLHYLTSTKLKKIEDQNIYPIILEALNPYKEKIKKITSCTLNGHSIFDDNLTIELFKTKVDVKSLNHVFMIIIDNALDELVKKEDLKLNSLDISIKQELSHIRIDFTDNAGGIEKSKQKKIFEPLVKEKDSGGLGMGLHIAKNIINQHEGTLELESTAPISTFTIKLKMH
ncbi:MAG: PAS domain S-box protein [Campylobacterota bacterium]|nr:PAS domain S-box protein [Campylobacterota bacterium]